LVVDRRLVLSGRGAEATRPERLSTGLALIPRDLLPVMLGDVASSVNTKVIFWVLVLRALRVRAVWRAEEHAAFWAKLSGAARFFAYFARHFSLLYTLKSDLLT
jgi:hypothetical protein